MGYYTTYTLSTTQGYDNQAEVNMNVYAELPQSVGDHKYGGGLYTDAQMLAFADATHALRTQQPAPAPMSPTNRLVAYSAATRLRELGFEWDATAEAWLQPAPATQQAGWKCAPVEPTQAMLDAMQSGGWMVGNYRDMLAAAPQQEAQEPAAIVVPCHTPSGKRVALYSAKQDLPIGTKLYTGPQPSPTPQADSQPEPVREGNDDTTEEHPAARRMREDFEREYGRHHPIASALRRYYDTRKGYDDAWNRDREKPVTLDDVLKTEREVFSAADRAASAPADSVLEDAARYQLLRRGQHWSVIDGIGNDLRAEALDAAVDSARKQGANHD